MSDTIYADHAATTPLEPEAWEAMCYWLTKDFSNPAALYRSGIAAHQAVERARQSVAECLRCSASQIFFTSGGSESNTWAILSGAGRAGIGSREVVTTPIEHHSVGRACASLKNSGIAAGQQRRENRFACLAAGSGTAAQIGDHSIRQQRGRHDSGHSCHFHPLSKKRCIAPCGCCTGSRAYPRSIRRHRFSQCFRA